MNGAEQVAELSGVLAGGTAGEVGPVLRPGVYDDRETADFIAASVVRGRLAFQLTERCIEK